MSNRTDAVLREVFEDLAGSAPVPGGLARAALGRARRQRLRQAGLVGGAAVACAAAIAAGVVVGPTDPTPAPVAIAAKTRTIVAFGELYGVAPSSKPEQRCVRRAEDRCAVAATRGAYYSLLLDPATGEYEPMPYRRVLPSPDGDRALVWREDPRTRVGVWERRTGDVRWFDGEYDDTGGWSPDGERILLMAMPPPGEPAMVLANPDTMATTSVRLAKPTAGECIYMELVWMPGGEGVAESAYCRQAGIYRVDGIRTYDLTGRLTGTIPVPGRPVAYSPDGALILLDEAEGDGVIVVDAATGAERSRLPLQVGVSAPWGGGVVGWFDAQHLAVYSVTGEDGKNPRASLRVVDLSGATIATNDVPFHLHGERIFGTVTR